MQQLTLISEPRARHDNPSMSVLAAKAMRPAAAYLQQMIVAASEGRPRTAEGIAHLLLSANPGRWDEGTIRSAVSRAKKRGLIVPAGEGLTSRGRSAVAFKAAR